MYFSSPFNRVVWLSCVVVSAMALKNKDKFYCEMASPCVCVSVDNSRVDLGGINISLNLSTDVTLNYKPCPDDVQNPDTTAIKIVNATASTTTALASYMDVQFDIDDQISLVYSNSTGNFEVDLSCDPSAVEGNEYLTNFVNNTNQYSITLKTNRVCGLNLLDSIENSNTDSWSVFFSFLLFVIFIYVIGGSVINACLFNATGTDILPHYQFWSSQYNNIKGKLCGTSMMASAYESI
ncbi:uncharacterized protein LOC126843610 [Adelges cooleyi]|uniref:uncharacterized protein LOC126843610 n=1 Tax=Adelges cooleyi TaxID=133065 RepID=UPI0021802BD1|nr:uncharacterized protein LOC126843610 [Adelges cooleyi]